MKFYARVRISTGEIERRVAFDEKPGDAPHKDLRWVAERPMNVKEANS